MKKLTKMEADLLALEVVATTIAGVSYDATNKAIEYAIAKNIDIDTCSVSVGMASLYMNNHNNPTCVVKLCFQNFGKWDLWSPTLKINSTTIADEATMLSTWLYNMTNVDHDIDYEDCINDTNDEDTNDDDTNDDDTNDDDTNDDDTNDDILED